jgi:hypothetical protein
MPAWLPLFIASMAGTLIGAGVAWGVLRQRLAVLEQEVGTRDTGLRGAVHDHTTAILKLDGRLTALEERK